MSSRAIYIASRSIEDARNLATELMEAGHRITSRWHQEDGKFNQGISTYTDEERRWIAISDEVDIVASTTLVLISSPEGTIVPGGKHVETGMAIRMGLPVFVLGRRENVFHWHPRVRLVEDVLRLVEALAE